MQITIKNVRLAFPAIAAPQAFGDGEPAYGAKLIIEPESAAHAAIEDAIKKEADMKWAAKSGAILKRLERDNKVAFVKDEYRSKKTDEPYAGFEGMFYANTRNAKDQPSVFTKFGEKVTDRNEIERLAYSGAIVNASLDVWAMDNKWGQRINCSLRGIMLTGEGENFGGGNGSATENDFADLFADTPEAEDVL
jgi:hypothetical protein